MPEQKQPSAELPQGPEGQQQKPPQLFFDDANAVSTYCNLCRVSGTPEELVVDFGLNPNPYAQGDVHVKVDHRIAMSYWTAKRLFIALQQSLQRHEQAFGVIELNVRRRMMGPGPGATEEQQQQEGES